MKRLLALLLLVVAPAFAQQSPQYDYTVTNPTYNGLENINQQGATPTNLGDDGTRTGINIGFQFDFYGETFNLVNLSSNGLISFKNNINGCCSGESLPSNSNNDFGIFAIWTDLVNIGTSNPYYKTFGEEGDRRFVVGWYNQAMYYDANQRSSFEITLFEGSNNILLEYADINLNRTFTAGIQGYGSQGQYEQIYFGSNGNTLDNTSWLLTYSAVEPPPPPPPEEPVAPDCTINPNDPTCIINALIPDPTDEEFLADTGFDNGSDDGSEPVVEEEDPVQEEMFAEVDSMQEESFDDEAIDEQSLEEMLAEETEEVFEEEVVADVREIANEEKAAVLTDSISKDVLEAALSVAADAVSAATVAGGESASSSTSSDSSSRSTTLIATTSETVATTTESAAATESASETLKEESTESSAVAALDILDTGRQLGQEALSVTLALTETAATESLSEAENIAAVSSGDSVLASISLIETAAVVVTEEQQVASNETTTETVTEETVTAETEVVVAENNAESTESNPAEIAEQREETKEEVLVAVDTQTQQTTETAAEQREEMVVAETVTDTAVENVEQVIAEVQSEQPSAVEFTTVDQAMEVFASNVNQQATAEQEELENSIVQQAIAASQTNEEENKMGFAEAEAMTIASDPALANAFNVQPNTASLELLGVLGSRAEEKSDAELRAEQVVAANKEQQDAINANYMDADQSGILAAIGSETDVTSYRTAMIRDNNDWYKPEDIYKGIIIKDNVRGSYFLEKGNTDTYKKMVDEQYK